MFAQCKSCMSGGGWLRKGQPMLAASPRTSETPLSKAQQEAETPATVERSARKSTTPLRSLRKQASKLSGVTGAFSGKDDATPLRSLRKSVSKRTGVTGAFSGKSPTTTPMPSGKSPTTTPMPTAESPAHITPHPRLYPGTHLLHSASR